MNSIFQFEIYIFTHTYNKLPLPSYCRIGFVNCTTKLFHHRILEIFLEFFCGQSLLFSSGFAWRLGRDDVKQNQVIWLNGQKILDIR